MHLQRQCYRITATHLRIYASHSISEHNENPIYIYWYSAKRALQENHMEPYKINIGVENFWIRETILYIWQ